MNRFKNNNYPILFLVHALSSTNKPTQHFFAIFLSCGQSRILKLYQRPIILPLDNLHHSTWLITRSDHSHFLSANCCYYYYCCCYYSQTLNYCSSSGYCCSCWPNLLQTLECCMGARSCRSDSPGSPLECTAWTKDKYIWLIFATWINPLSVPPHLTWDLLVVGCTFARPLRFLCRCRRIVGIWLFLHVLRVGQLVVLLPLHAPILEPDLDLFGERIHSFNYGYLRNNFLSFLFTCLSDKTSVCAISMRLLRVK